jgi:hypothetical protein
LTRFTNQWIQISVNVASCLVSVPEAEARKMLGGALPRFCGGLRC